MSRTLDTVAEIDPAAFEQELRDGADVIIVDTRDRDAFATWHVDPSSVPLRNVPEAELAADRRSALSALAADARLRMICNAGNASRRAAAVLQPHAREALSVRGGLIGWSRVLQRGEIPLAGPAGVVQFRREARGCLSYLVIAGGEALVVDPAPDVQPYLDEAARRGVRIARVLDTHVHADHLSGARELARRTGAALHLSHAALARGVRYADEVAPVGDGDELALGLARPRVVALPGHTSDMIGLQVGDAALIGGDALFADSVARPDLETGDEGAAGAARQLHRSLRQRIAPLPDSTILLPCHYAGGRLDAPLAVHLSEVRAAVPELALDEDEFVERVLSAMPPLGQLPVDHRREPWRDAWRGGRCARDRRKQLRRKRRMVERRPSMKLDRLFQRGGAIDVREAARRLDAGELVLVDVRDAAAWRTGHAPGAQHVPLARLPRESDALAGRGQPVAFVCRSGHRSAAACAVGRCHGIEALNVRGGMAAWQRAGLPVTRD